MKGTNLIRKMTLGLLGLAVLVCAVFFVAAQTPATTPWSGSASLHALRAVPAFADEMGGLSFQDIIRMMPPDTWLIAYADVKEVLGQPALRQLADNILTLIELEERGFEKLIADFSFETGVHPVDEVERVVLMAGLLEGDDDPSIAIMAQANWDAEGTTGFFSNQTRLSLIKEGVAGETVFGWAREERPPEVGLTFPSQQLLLAGYFPTVKEMVSLRHGEDANALDGRMRKALNGADRKVMIWGVGAAPAPALKEVYQQLQRRRRTGREDRLEYRFFQCVVVATSFSCSLKPAQDGGVLAALTCHTLVEEDTAKYARTIEAFRQMLAALLQEEIGRSAKRGGEERVETQAFRLLTDGLRTSTITPRKGAVDIRLHVRARTVNEINALLQKAAEDIERRWARRR